MGFYEIDPVDIDVPTTESYHQQAAALPESACFAHSRFSLGSRTTSAVYGTSCIVVSQTASQFGSTVLTFWNTDHGRQLLQHPMKYFGPFLLHGHLTMTLRTDRNLNPIRVFGSS